MPKRKEVKFITPSDEGWSRREAIELTVTRKGIEVCGYYDSIVGLEGFSLTWAEVDAARAKVNALP